MPFCTFVRQKHTLKFRDKNIYNYSPNLFKDLTISLHLLTKINILHVNQLLGFVMRGPKMLNKDTEISLKETGTRIEIAWASG